MSSEPRTLHSVIVPVGSRVDDLAALLDEYASVLADARIDFEIIVVVDGPRDALMQQLSDFGKEREWLRVIQFSRPFGESAALMAGFAEARGDVLVTLPANWQVVATEIPRLIESAGEQDDMLIAVRWPYAGSTFSRLRRRVFHRLLHFVTGFGYRDLGCAVRLLRRRVADEIRLYGDQHRFLPLLAVRRGFRVREVEVQQSPKDRHRGGNRWQEYVHRVLDLMTVFFLVRFTKKPLRFFGSLGFIAGGIGAVFVLVLVTQRLFFDVPLADRPALLLASLLLVLGVQLFGLGLLGELVIFAHGTKTKEYAIRTIIGGGVGGRDGSRASEAPATAAADESTDGGGITEKVGT
jgi:glycosyltransferase involved in cell wall biosynthesis